MDGLVPGNYTNRGGFPGRTETQSVKQKMTAPRGESNLLSRGADAVQPPGIGETITPRPEENCSTKMRGLGVE